MSAICNSGRSRRPRWRWPKWAYRSSIRRPTSCRWWSASLKACKAATDRLLAHHGIYIQPINYPTVPRGSERLRITPTPLHSDAHIRELAKALAETWTVLKLPCRQEAAAAE